MNCSFYYPLYAIFAWGLIMCLIMYNFNKNTDFRSPYYAVKLIFTFFTWAIVLGVAVMLFILYYSYSNQIHDVFDYINIIQTTLNKLF